MYNNVLSIIGSGLVFIISDLPAVLILIIAYGFKMIRCVVLTNTTDVYVDS